MDRPEPDQNPNLDYQLVDAANAVTALRDEGKKVQLHCIAAHSRTPTVGIVYAMLRGHSLAEATASVCGALPAASPNSGFQAAMKRLETRLVDGA